MIRELLDVVGKSPGELGTKLGKRVTLALVQSSLDGEIMMLIGIVGADEVETSVPLDKNEVALLIEQIKLFHAGM